MASLQDRLRRSVRYDPLTGEFWRGGRKIAKPDKRGYCRVWFEGKLYLAHHVAWAYMTGAWPTNEVDHSDTKPSNNRWENLREASSSQNKMNSVKRGGTTSKYKGVSWSTTRNKWAVFITIEYRRIFLGRFDNEEVAAAVYWEAARKNFGEFARAA